MIDTNDIMRTNVPRREWRITHKTYKCFIKRADIIWTKANILQQKNIAYLLKIYCKLNNFLNITDWFLTHVRLQHHLILFLQLSSATFMRDQILHSLFRLNKEHIDLLLQVQILRIQNMRASWEYCSLAIYSSKFSWELILCLN